MTTQYCVRCHSQFSSMTRLNKRFVVTRLPKGPLAIAQSNLPAHRLAGQTSLIKCRRQRLHRREPCEEPSQVYFRTLCAPWMGWLSSSPTETRTRQRSAERAPHRLELPQPRRIPSSVSTASIMGIAQCSSFHVPRFSISSTHIVPRTYIRDPLVIADIQRREERCRQNGGIGTLVVIIQCGSTSQVVPVEVDPPAKIAWDSRDDWAQVLAHFVESGRTDFKPISTTPRG